MGFTPEQKATFDGLYEKLLTASEDLKLVRIVDQMLELLVVAGEAQIKYIGVARVVPHIDNRSGSLMEVRKVYTKGSKILAVGFSLARCDPKRAVAFQAKPGGDPGVEQFVEYARQSQHLATFEASAVEACSVGCGHLNQFLAAVRAECEVPAEFIDHPDIFGPAGDKKLDSLLICRSQDPEFEWTVEQGLK